MTVQDFLINLFSENIATISIFDMAVSIVLAFALGLFIFAIYKKTYSGVMYSGSFGISLIALAMVTTLAILAVTTNVVLSLGMVGALSIVRFRAAIKDPTDIVFLFWSIAVGIVIAAGMLFLAIFASLFIGFILVIFVNKKAFHKPYILHINCTGNEAEKMAAGILDARVKSYSIKSKSVAKGSCELHYEVRLKNENTDFVDELSQMEGISNVILVSYSGDYVG